MRRRLMSISLALDASVHHALTMLSEQEIKAAGYTHLVNYPRTPGANQSLPQYGAKSLVEARRIAAQMVRGRKDLRRRDAHISLAKNGQFVELCGPSR